MVKKDFSVSTPPKKKYSGLQIRKEFMVGGCLKIIIQETQIWVILKACSEKKNQGLIIKTENQEIVKNCLEKIVIHP